MNNLRKHKQRGAALFIFMLLFLVASTTLVFGITRAVYQDILHHRTLVQSKESFFATEGAGEDAIYRHRKGLNYSTTETVLVAGISTTVTRDITDEYITFDINGIQDSAYRKGYLELAIGDGASFNFGLQSGNGGISLSNNSSVLGNVFSNGAVIGAGSATVYGDVIVAGAAGYIESFYATGTVYAHTINDMEIDGDAYYFATSSITGSIVGGISYPGSSDQATATLPISDEDVEGWKDWITASGTVITAADPECSSGTYTISSDTTIGLVKIECDFLVEQNVTTLTLTGPVWVSGNIYFEQGPTVAIDSAVGARSVQFIADNESDRLTSSKIFITQSTNFLGSGSPKSYVLLLSMNESAETGGTEVAIDLANSADGDVLLYAGHGLVNMGNNISLKEVTAYQINISNGADVIYESGLVNLLFTSGPGGGYTIHNWEEVQ